MMNMTETGHLMRQYARSGSEDAFREIVSRYVNLVHSAALRLVNGNDALARDVAQTVFIDLARAARSMPEETALGGWLHRHTCFVASKALRAERRRRLREEKAFAMSSPEADADHEMALLAPVLDEAINQLKAEDRQAVILRYFDQLEFGAVGEALGTNEEAARKRVNRALDKLQALLRNRGVALSTAVVASALGAHAVQAAPVGLAAALSATALASAGATASIATTLQLFTMTKLQTTCATALLLAAVSVPFVLQHKAKSKLAAENHDLRLQAAQVEELSAENLRLSNLLARSKAAVATSAPSPEQNSELLKLRGQVGVLRQTATEAVATAESARQTPSPLADLAQDPALIKALRDQQRMGMASIYQGMAKRANLSPEAMEKFNDTLADYVMTNITHLTDGLRENRSPAEMERLFAQEEAALDAKVKEIAGDAGFKQWQEYNRDLASYITAEQFKGMMLQGDKETKDRQGRQLFELLQEESARARAAAGVGENYQLIPSLNFRNIASEQQGEASIQLLDSIYEQTAARAGSFLSPAELEKFQEFRKLAVNNNRIGLAMNRKLMSPPVK